MKSYLSFIKESSVDSLFRADIHDVFLPLEDMGYKVSIRKTGQEGLQALSVTISLCDYKKKNFDKYDSVCDELIYCINKIYNYNIVKNTYYYYCVRPSELGNRHMVKLNANIVNAESAVDQLKSIGEKIRYIEIVVLPGERNESVKFKNSVVKNQPSGESFFKIGDVFSKLSDNGNIVGNLHYRIGKNCLHIVWLDVQDDYKRKGYGDMIIKEAIKRAEKNDCDCIRLEVLKSNLPAVSLYKKHGFEIEYEDSHYLEMIKHI